MTKIQNKKHTLLPPCTYQGGKQRVAKQIIDFVLSNTKFDSNTKFYDLCCGSGAISIELLNRGFSPNNIIMLDISSWGKFWRQIGSGNFELDKFLSYANQVPQDKNLIQDFMKNLTLSDANVDEEYKFILLQSAAFGGTQICKKGSTWSPKSFRNYWQPTATSNRRSPVNPMQPSVDTIIGRMTELVPKCLGITGIQNDIHTVLDLLNNENSIVYIDPPYTGTSNYDSDFNVLEFVKQVHHKLNCFIYVSEKEKLEGAQSIQLDFSGDKGGMNGNKKSKNEEWLNVFSTSNLI